MDAHLYNCTYCGKIFSNRDYHFKCGRCGENYCSSDCGDQGNWDDIPSNCRVCRRQYVVDKKLLEFLLKKLSLTREAAEELYFDNIEEGEAHA